ncbi:uncharacterized protein Dmoj_GI12737 [Drosophila mojavensis]|uniref:Uncharacterized protein n=1 Tax=Drosophila mojavensis TaxID=7230 RepID=B4KX93_DROMO|nr:uncharacterized protein Dmoj_GI12737 [Drosophila mojavensis]
MSSGSSNIDPIELDDAQVPLADDPSNEERRPVGRRRRRGGPEYVRPQIEVVRRNAQQIYHRRRPIARQRSSSQQTESTSRPIHVVGPGGHVTVLLRLMSQHPGQREVEVGTTIRMTIDMPDTPPSMMGSHTIRGLNATIRRNPSSAGQPRAQPRSQGSQQPLQREMGVPTLQPYRQSLPESQYLMESQNQMARQCRLPRREGPPVPVIPPQLDQLFPLSLRQPEPSFELGPQPGTEPPSEPEVELPVQEPSADPQPEVEPQSSSGPQPQLSSQPPLQTQTQELDPNPQTPSSK